MKNKISYGFLLGLALWIFIILLGKKGVCIPLINSYLTDFITVPMYAYLIEYLMNEVMGYYWKPDFKFILSSTIYLSLLFEVVCPILSDRFTGDILDVVAYLTGSLTCYFLKPILQRIFKREHI